jgi:hypothetical protein
MFRSRRKRHVRFEKILPVARMEKVKLRIQSEINTIKSYLTGFTCYNNDSKQNIQLISDLNLIMELFHGYSPGLCGYYFYYYCATSTTNIINLGD